MLLRRITKHVKDQNWTAVGIDFVIVVVGVFIGIQVANWNDTRIKRAVEAQFLEQLTKDLLQGDAIVSSYIDRQSARFDAFASALSKLEEVSSQPLTDDECNALGASAVVATGLPALPSFEELRATDGLDLIRDSKIKSALSKIALNMNFINELIDRNNRHIVAPGQAYPHLIKLKHYFDEAGEVRVKSQCDHIAMGADQGFLNAMTINLDIQESLKRRTQSAQASYSDLRDRLNELAGKGNVGISQ